MNLKKIIFILFNFTVISSFLFSTKLIVGQDKVVKVNNRVITIKELEKEFEQRSKLPSLDGSQVTKASVLESMIDEDLLKNDVKAKSIVLDENQVNQMLEQYKMMYAQEMAKTNPNFEFNEEEYKAYIQKEVKITYEKFVEKVKDTVMVRQFIMKRAEKKLQDATTKVFSDSKLEEFYDENVNEFVVPRSVELKHIFLKTVGYDGKILPDTEKQIVKKRIDDIYARIKKGESFDTLCELNSEDIESRDRKNPKTGKIDRGYLGILTVKDDVAKQQFGEVVFKALFNLEKGKYSEVMESKVGYHIFYSVDKKSQYIVPFEEAKVQITNYFRLLEQDKIVKEEFLGVIKELRNKASIEYYIDEYKPKK